METSVLVDKLSLRPRFISGAGSQGLKEQLCKTTGVVRAVLSSVDLKDLWVMFVTGLATTSKFLFSEELSALFLLSASMRTRKRTWGAANAGEFAMVYYLNMIKQVPNWDIFCSLFWI